MAWYRDPLGRIPGNQIPQSLVTESRTVSEFCSRGVAWLKSWLLHLLSWCPWSLRSAPLRGYFRRTSHANCPTIRFCSSRRDCLDRRRADLRRRWADGDQV